MKCVTLETVKKMSDEELRVAVAKLDGWESIAKTRHGYLEGFKPGVNYVGVPDYPHDLNAVHEVEERLDQDQRDHYYVKLAVLVGETNSYRAYWHILHSTARQRCEALVLCLSPDSKNTNV